MMVPLSKPYGFGSLIITESLYSALYAIGSSFLRLITETNATREIELRASPLNPNVDSLVKSS